MTIIHGHARKCSECDALFVATPKDVRWKEFACRTCRETPPEPLREGTVGRHGTAYVNAATGRVRSIKNSY